MLNSKQRAKLKSLAANENAIMQIGKGGVGEALAKTVSDALEARELVKLSVLESSGDSPKETADELAALTGSEVVSVIGRKIILYRRSEKNRIEL